jgi:hypothetical protein
VHEYSGHMSLSGGKVSGDLSDFNYTMAANDHAALAGALETIKEHHPGQAVWVEG